MEEFQGETALQPPKLSRNITWSASANTRFSADFSPLARVKLQRTISQPTQGAQLTPGAVQLHLEVLLRRSLDPVFAKAVALQGHAGLPFVEPRHLGWATPGPAMQTEGVEWKLSQLEEKLTALLQSLMSTEGGPSVAAEKIQYELLAARTELADHPPERLASIACRLHARVSSICIELEGHILQDRDIKTTSGNTVGGKDESGAAVIDEAQTHRAARELSREQHDIVECPHSVFVQGRSGTGKTIVITRRMLARRAQSGSNGLSQLFVTKSSLLRDQVARDLEMSGICLDQDWPPSGTLCVTWEKLIGMLGQHLRASLNWNKFLEIYWPELRGKARQLTSQLIWAEFNTRLRPFGGSRVRTDLSLEEYLESDLAALGIRLEREDQLAAYDCFKKYNQLKNSRKEFDDIDIASMVLRRTSPNIIDELYVDEAQDFAPMELVVFMALCRNPDGVTVAGDTCQTINPGSSFSFHDIVEAFHERWRVVEKSCRSADKGASENLETLRECEARALNCQVLTLYYNYRCSPGVAGLAGSVVRLLLQRFPFAADYVREEMMLQQVHGLPVVAQLPAVNLNLCISGTGSQALSSMDASRVGILVRSDNVRRNLRNRLGSFLGIPILTVAESKGLEFELVLICNFLSDGPDSTIWNLADEESQEAKVTALAVRAQDLIYGAGAAAKLDHKTHRLLCRTIQAITELKNLYVAITRARAGCVLLEDKPQPEVFRPLVSSWQVGGLVECWNGLHEYAIGVATESEEASGAPSEEALAGLQCEELASALHEEALMEWITRQLAARIGPAEKKARNALAKERTRLRDGGDADPKFCTKFEASYGVVDGVGPNTVKRHVQFSGDIPSVLPAMERRFCAASTGADAELGAVVQDLKVRGQQLLRHAMDDARERWQVFGEARRLFLEGLRMYNSIVLPTQGAWQSVELAGSASAATTVDEVRHVREIAVCMRAACHAPSWRGHSVAARLRKLILWKYIFSFLAPADVQDTYNSVALIAERVVEFSVVRQELRRQSCLSWAWYLLNSSRYDAVARAREESTKQSLSIALNEEQSRRTRVRERHVGPEQSRFDNVSNRPPLTDLTTDERRAILANVMKAWNQVVCGGLHHAATVFGELDALYRVRANKCAEAGRAFLALQMPDLAAQAHSEAAATFRLTPQVLKSGHPLCCKVLQISGPQRAMLEFAAAEARAESVNAAHCALLMAPGSTAGRPGPGTRSGVQALLTAAEHFAAGGLAVEACLCAARTGHLRAALSHLVPGRKQFMGPGLLCAAILGEIPRTLVEIEIQRHAASEIQGGCNLWRERVRKNALQRWAKEKQDISKALGVASLEPSAKQAFEQRLHQLSTCEIIETAWNPERAQAVKLAMERSSPAWFYKALAGKSIEEDAICDWCGTHVYTGMGGHIWDRCSAISHLKKEWVRTLPKSSQALVQNVPWRYAKPLIRSQDESA